MRREYLPPTALYSWAELNNIVLNGVTISQVPNGRGLGVVATAKSFDENAVLMAVPPQLILSLETVWIYAKSDPQLKEVLDAVGEYSQTARGAILIFLLIQITHKASKKSERVGASSPWTDYVKFLPSRVPLPTFWSEEEKFLVVGTSLEAALSSKLKSLDREFAHLREFTSSIGWCQKHWWMGDLTFDDWKQVDAMYRSRALDLPRTGHAMVPCIDMANHASDEDTVALYDTDDDGNAVLLLREGKKLKAGDEVSITYGDQKGACEMLFSYGFIEDTMTSARELFLHLEIPDDDPLKLAKKTVAKSAPGFKLFVETGSISWDGDYVWLICVNEEDGLDFRVLQTNNGDKELKMFWHEDEVQDTSKLRNLLEGEPIWDVFRLRAVATLQGRVEQQLLALERSRASINNRSDPTVSVTKRLRDLEEELMLQACEQFEKTVFLEPKPSFVCPIDRFVQTNRLHQSQVVKDYLQTAAKETRSSPDDDFS